MLQEQGYNTEIVPLKSDGDIELDLPLYEMGITGVFTKTLDVALVKGEIDIAVHSLKDVPTALPKGMVTAAVLDRANPVDLLVHKGAEFLNRKGLIATSSLRRKAQWLYKYPKHEVTNLRGNVNTRLIKLIENNWNGAIFARAGLERLRLLPKDAIELDWMLPAPAQGAVSVACMAENTFAYTASEKLNHRETEIAVTVEREFLRTLEGGCTAPIGALATVEGDDLHFEGALFALDGSEKISVNRTVGLAELANFGADCAQEIKDKGGKALMETIKNEIDSVH